MAPTRTKKTKPTKTPQRKRPTEDREAVFAAAYVATLNATQAAKDAKYAAKTARVMGAKLLTRPRVQALIAEHQAKLKQDCQVEAETVVRELVRIGTADLRDVISWSQDGVKFKDSADIDTDAARAIASVKSRERTHFDRDGKEVGRTVNLEIKMHPKAPALEGLAKHLGLYKDSLGDGLRDLANAIDSAWQRAQQPR